MCLFRIAAVGPILVGILVSPSLADRPAAQMPMHGEVMADPSHREDMQVFHYLLEHRAKITRSVTNLPDGIETVTLSDDAEVAITLRVHVAAMVARMEQGRPIHARDPFFAEMFRQAKHVAIKVEPLPTGVRVIETSPDAYTVSLLQEHGTHRDAVPRERQGRDA